MVVAAELVYPGRRFPSWTRWMDGLSTTHYLTGDEYVVDVGVRVLQLWHGKVMTWWQRGEAGTAWC